MNRNLRRVTRTKLLSLVFLLLIPLLMLSAGARTSSSSSLGSSYPVLPLVGIKLINSPNTAGVLSRVTFSGLILNPALAPSQIYVNYSVEANGVVSLNNGCVIYHLTGLTYTPCSFTMPYHASANAILLASYKNGQGQLVAGLIEDPMAEPEW